MKVDAYKCDECGVEKKSTNHWFLFDEGTSTALIATWESPAKAGAVKHICGQQCMQKVLEQWMSSK